MKACPTNQPAAGAAPPWRKIEHRPQDFARSDETDDALFYARQRLVSHLDATALATIERLIASLVVEERPAILDLMASWDSHLPEGLRPARVSGLGLNSAELAANPALDERVIHDLNRDPGLPFAGQSFDLVLNVVSVDYLTRPLEVFAESARVLKPGGLFLVIFSNRWFEPKVTEVWRASGEQERVILVEEWMRATGLFEEPRAYLSKGRPRPADDKYAGLGLTSDPVYAVFAERLGGAPGRPGRLLPRGERPQPPADPRALAREVGQSLRCPYCGQKMRKWEVPQTPFTEWDTPHMFVCFNDECPYLVRGWEEMARQGNFGSSYRLMHNPANQSLHPIMVHSLSMLKDGILD